MAVPPRNPDMGFEPYVFPITQRKYSCFAGCDTPLRTYCSIPFSARQLLSRVHSSYVDVLRACYADDSSAIGHPERTPCTSRKVSDFVISSISATRVDHLIFLGSWFLHYGDCLVCATRAYMKARHESFTENKEAKDTWYVKAGLALWEWVDLRDFG